MTKLPTIQSCEADVCFYNTNRLCHAPAITVGSTHPNCDTFIAPGQHIHRREPAEVGACHVESCSFNVELTCSAPGIIVAMHDGHADCRTYRARP